ncbi:MAG TPA: putative metalloprotease CJM1_0395 family protein, partial [Gammaproteobacteria bacterium]|nr:putative metalloprotease CJM1_0395 family protein [Gammaproteobacteria bacterium]
MSQLPRVEGPSRPRAETGSGEAGRQGREVATEATRVEAMKARDREVRAHEAAHRAAGGTHVRGGTRLDYQRGPNGVMYAVGGEVRIDTSPVHGDPEATVEKARQVRHAALAPRKPSSQDWAVAGRALQMALQAQAELAAKAGGEGPAKE